MEGGRAPWQTASRSKVSLYKVFLFSHLDQLLVVTDLIVNESSTFLLQ